MPDPSLLRTILLNLFGKFYLHEGDLAIKDHIKAAVDWIKIAHQSSNAGGISKGYDLLRARWSPPYPETTGYTIPTLLNVAQIIDCTDVHVLAIQLANYLHENSTQEGGVVYWDVKSNPTPIVFDTGQVIFGWLAAYDATSDENFLSAAKKSGDWLVTVQDSSGSWRMHQHLGVEKVIDTRVSWSLLELFKRTNCDQYAKAAVKNLDWAIQQQSEDGWFEKCAFLEGKNPFTHTIAYTAEGLLESGMLLSENRYIEAARKTTDAMLMCQRKNGSLSSTYGSGWKETSRSSCLTGDCQFGIVWLRFYEISGHEAYLDAAKRVISYVAGTQNLESSNPNIRGAIAGSYPIYGLYERFKYPNWAAKFFIDAFLRLYEVNHNTRVTRYVG